MAIAPVKSKILVIENQQEDLSFMVIVLRLAGYEVTSARSGQEGIRLTRNEEFDLIVVNIDLSDMSGFDVCARLKQDFRFDRTPFIFVSAHLSEADRQRGSELSAAGFIAKPFDTFTFVSQIKSCVKPGKSIKPLRREYGSPT